ncbi:MAG: hypothetical protein IJU15_08650 [Synergistaceae bacterium]|nr:hypothetical protein [Synergistaceae bacterium]MBR0205025.1 hypothetical protein [Synergistaceae bacterium]
MKASKKVAVFLLLALMFGIYQPKPARAFDWGQVAKWVAEAVVIWGTTEALNAAKAEATAPKDEKKDEEKSWYHYLWPGNWF